MRGAYCIHMTNTDTAAVTAARAAYAAAAKSSRCTARRAFNAAAKAARAVTGDAKLAELAADTAMQLETNGNLTLNDLRWSEFSGGVGH